MRKAVLFIIVFVIATASAAWWSSRRVSDGAMVFQGYVEADLVHVAAEETAIIRSVLVAAGDEVLPGQVLVQLDDSLHRGQHDEAAARLAQAEATLENLRKGMQRPEQIAILESQEAQARAGLDRSRLEYDRQRALFARGIVAKASLDQSKAGFDRDSAALQEAERQIAAARMAARSDEIEAAQAAVRAATAALAQARTKVAKTRLSASAGGRVQDVYFRAGEVVNAGQPILAFLPPGNLKIRFFVPEPVLSTLARGQTVTIDCDRCPAGLSAEIAFLASQAEFTPPVIFSDAERAKLVFRGEARKISMPLPTGLPVSVRPARALVATREGRS